MKTINDYSTAIRSKYLRDSEKGKLKSEIAKLTPGNIKKLCINLLKIDLSQSDQKVFREFFEANSFEDVALILKKYDIDKFRPICKFLKQENDSIQSHYTLELIAILVSFDERPYNNFRNNSFKKKLSPKYIGEKQSDLSTTSLDESTNNKNPFKWTQTVSKPLKFRILKITITVLICLFLLIYFLKDKTRWMVWKGNQYVEVAFDPEKYKINQLKFYKEERILNFKKIIPDCNTQFFNDDGSENLWYGKNANGELEYFTDLGLHPETGNTLKKITRYMIKKYICEL